MGILAVMARTSTLLFAGLVCVFLTISSAARADLAAAIDDYYAGNYDAAARQFQQLADGGDSDAQRWLGFIYTTGKGVGQDWEQARIWYERSIENGNAQALSFLGDLYYYGQGVEKDFLQATRYYRQGANRGDGNGLFNLGYAYENGEGARRDQEKAVALYRAASGQGFSIERHGFLLVAGRAFAVLIGIAEIE